MLSVVISSSVLIVTMLSAVILSVKMKRIMLGVCMLSVANRAPSSASLASKYWIY